MGVVVTSTTVEGNPPGVGPASRINATSDPRLSKTCSAVLGLGAPLRFALVAVTGSAATSSSLRTRGSPGTRIPIVPVPAVTRAGILDEAWKTKVSGPGQNRSIKVLATGGMERTNSETRPGRSTSTRIGF